MKNNILLSILFIFYSCSSIMPGGKVDPSKTYKYDMIVTVDGVVYEGGGVLPDKKVGMYDFKVEARGDLDLFSLSTCSKELNAERAWNVETKVPFLLFWSRKIVEKRKYNFQYSRDQLERALSVCQIQLEGLNEKEGKHSWALFDVQDEKTTLPAWVTCNLEHYPSPGVTMCRNQADSWMQITTEEDALISPARDEKGAILTPGCIIPTERGRVFTFQIQAKRCVYNIMGIPTGRVHRLTTVGWQDILLRS